jgi:hypothetical protein
MVNRGVTNWRDTFRRAQSYSTTPGFLGWTIKDTSAAGTPTYANGADGAVLTLAATSEAEIVTLYQNDIKIFSLADLAFVEIVAKVSGIDAVTTLVMGLASAQNDTADSIQESVWFRMEGSASLTAVVTETDDNVTNNDDKATGHSLASTFKTFRIDFERGLRDVRFLIEGQRVSEGTTFDMSGAASGTTLQPFVQLQKASGTGTPAVTIRDFWVQTRYAYGA